MEHATALPRYQSPSPYLAGLLLVSTAVVFWGDIHLRLGAVPWLSYLLLVFIASRLYARRIVFSATAGWSLLIVADLLLSSSDSLTMDIVNRGIGLITLWLVVYFLEKEKRADLERRESALRLRAIMDGALDAVIGMSHSGHIIEWSPQAERTFGYARHEAMGSSLAELIIPPIYREAHAHGLKRFLDTGTHSILHKRIEITALHRDGHEFPAELTVIPLRFGPHITFCAFLRDITEQKRAQEDLRHSRAFLDSVVEHLPNMVFVKNAKTLQFVRFNKAGEDLLGYRESELMGKTDYDVFPKDQADLFTAHDRAVLESGRLQDIPEERIQTTHKGERIVHTKKIPLFDSSGIPQYVLGISEDITERKIAEDALRRSQKAAEAANEAKSEFLANVSHEIRTPLNAILGTLELLTESSTTANQQAYASMGKRAGQVLLRLVNDLLDAVKFESGTLRMETRPFDLRENLLRTQHMMTPRAKSKGLELHVRVDEAVPANLQGDATRLQQILLNLIGNAIKFTEEGHVTLSVSVTGDVSTQRFIQFSITDSGIGIPKEQFSTIFERFTQVDSGDSRKYGGTGLGLSICKQLVTLMGGRIWVESELGHGSTFVFTLPWPVPEDKGEKTPARHPDAETQATRPPAVPVVAPSPLRILFVDDFQETIQLAAAFLKKLPYQLDTADNGKEAVERCATGQYDLVLLDMQMPGMDGYTVAAAIRSWEQEQRLPPTPIVAVTADVLRSAQERSSASGCTGFLGKPFSKEQLIDTIQRYARVPGTSAQRHPRTRATRLGSALPGDQELETLRAAFLQKRQHDIDTLTAALASGEWETIGTLGHRMKGLAGSYGLEEIGRIGAALEQAAARRDHASIEPEIDRLRQAVSREDKKSGQAA